MDLLTSVGKARSSEKEDEVWGIVPVCAVLERCVLCGRCHHVYDKKASPGGVLNHQMSGKTLIYRPSAKMKNIKTSEMESHLEEHGYLFPLLSPPVSPSHSPPEYVVPGPCGFFVWYGSYLSLDWASSH